MRKLILFSVCILMGDCNLISQPQKTSPGDALAAELEEKRKTQEELNQDLNTAIAKNNFSTAQALLEKGADPNSARKTAIYSIAVTGSGKLIRLLLSFGASIKEASIIQEAKPVWNNIKTELTALKEKNITKLMQNNPSMDRIVMDAQIALGQGYFEAVDAILSHSRVKKDPEARQAILSHALVLIGLDMNAKRLQKFLKNHFPEKESA